MIQLNTQREALERQAEELRTKIQAEFGVSSPDDLEKLRQTELDKLSQVYAELGQHLNPVTNP
jgi:carboxylesterase type B